MPANAYEYDDEEPGMQDAVERAREKYAMAADNKPVAYDPAEQPLPADEPTVLPEMDFTDKGFGAPDDSSAEMKSDLQTQHGSGPAPSPKPRPEPETGSNEEYLSALRRIKGLLSKPTPDYAPGYAEAQQKDASENRTNRILDFLSAGLRRAPTANLTPAATNASDFLKKQSLGQQHDETELARAGKLAAVARPAKGVGKDAGNLEGLRSYLVKVGAGTEEELAGMNEKQLGAVKEAYGLKYRAGQDEQEAARASEHFAETKRHNKETEGAAWRAANRAENEKPLSPTTINDISDFDVADKALGQLEKDFNELGMSGPVARASGVASEALGLTGTDAAVYLNKAKQAQQVVGKILEGGKLAAGDEAKYRQLIPQPGDSQKLLASKVSGLRAFLSDMKDGRIRLYREGGYKTPGGKVRMSNGKETLMVEAADEAEAAREGFKRAQ